MTLRLILTRHAKSSWNAQASDDHSRPLDPRGTRGAAAIGKWMSDKGYVPDLVLCSDATRTRETWTLVNDQLPTHPDVRFERALYLSSPDTMLQLAQKDEGPRCKMIIAHNPGSAFFAGAMAKASPSRSDFDRYPTAATTVFELQCDRWADVRWGMGDVIDFVTPKDLRRD